MSGPLSFDTADFTDKIFRISGEQEFNALALQLFHYQYLNNELYREFCDLLKAVPENVYSFDKIPFLPIQFFRDHDVVTHHRTIPTGTSRTFLSSATTGSTPSRHFVSDTSLYEKSFTEGFQYFYGHPEGHCFLAVLPGYLERPGSSLVYMMDHLIRMTEVNGSGFFLHDLEVLRERVLRQKSEGRPTILIGVTHALMDLAGRFPMDLEGVIVMETGGMKGKRKEIVREELHEFLCKAFHVDAIHSEYGMTELLSQAYSKGNGIYETPPWMKILVREVNDPLSLAAEGDTGGLNIIDLANVHSCAFVATQDLGRKHMDGSFEVLGRFDSSDIRGCSLMVS